MFGFFFYSIIFIVHNHTPVYRLDCCLKVILMIFLGFLLMKYMTYQHILMLLIHITKWIFSILLYKINLSFLLQIFCFFSLIFSEIICKIIGMYMKFLVIDLFWWFILRIDGYCLGVDRLIWAIICILYPIY